MEKLMEFEAPTEAQVEKAKLDYQYSLSILLAAQRGDAIEAGKAMVGKCFKYENGTDSDTWWLYMAVTTQDEHGVLSGWRFQQSPAGQAEVAEERTIEPRFIVAKATEIPRAEFVAAFNELLTGIARYVNRLPA